MMKGFSTWPDSPLSDPRALGNPTRRGRGSAGIAASTSEPCSSNSSACARTRTTSSSARIRKISSDRSWAAHRTSSASARFSSRPAGRPDDGRERKPIGSPHIKLDAAPGHIGDRPAEPHIQLKVFPVRQVTRYVNHNAGTNPRPIAIRLGDTSWHRSDLRADSRMKIRQQNHIRTIRGGVGFRPFRSRTDRKDVVFFTPFEFICHAGSAVVCLHRVSFPPFAIILPRTGIA